jgi:hypothetical protein
MIKDVMVRLDGTSGDDARLAAATQIAQIFESHITGLFFNVVPDGLNGFGANPPNRQTLPGRPVMPPKPCCFSASHSYNS